MDIVKRLLGAALYTSVILGVQILSMDSWLWSAAPSHAYGLIAFVIIDAALLAVMWRNPKFATFAVALTGLLQLAAMLADASIGAPAGITEGLFKNYLFADRAFTSLLVTQVAIIVFAVVSLVAPLVHFRRLPTLRLNKHPT